MLIVGQLLVLAGYTLIYAGVANGGALASNPTAALLTDAYTGGSAVTPSASNASVGGVNP
jgi:hypothetical protein